MKITSLLTYISALSLALFFAQMIADQNAMLTAAGFCISVLALLFVRDYTPRSYYLVTLDGQVNQQPPSPEHRMRATSLVG